MNPVLEGSTDGILQEMMRSNYGEHNLLIYQDLSALKEIYSRYFKNRLESNKETILYLSTYQNVDRVRRTLRDVDLDVARYEENGSLVILDSVRGYFGSDSDILSQIKISSKRAQNQGWSGCCVIADMGMFYLIKDEQRLLKCEVSMPLRFDTDYDSIKCKIYCCYHQKDFNRFTKDERALLLEHHYRKLVIVNGGGQTNASSNPDPISN